MRERKRCNWIVACSMSSYHFGSLWYYNLYIVSKSKAKNEVHNIIKRKQENSHALKHIAKIEARSTLHRDLNISEHSLLFNLLFVYGEAWMRKDRNLENVWKFIYIFVKPHGNVLVDLSIMTVYSYIPVNMKFIQKMTRDIDGDCL